MVNFSGEPSGWVFPLLREYLLCGLLHQLDLTTANEMPGSHKKQLFPSQFFVFFLNCPSFVRFFCGGFSVSPGANLEASPLRGFAIQARVSLAPGAVNSTKGGGNSHVF